LDIFTNRHSSQRETDRRATPSLPSPFTNGCDLRVDAKNDIFTWTFEKKKKKKEVKARREERTDREVKLSERAEIYCMDAISIHFH